MSKKTWDPGIPESVSSSKPLTDLNLPTQNIPDGMKLHKYKVLKVDLIVTTVHGYSIVYKDVTNTLFQDFQILPFVKHS